MIRAFLPNGPAGDPLVLVELLDAGQVLLLDLGDLRRVANRKLLRVGRVVVTHTHLDHFIGFDHLLRLALDRERELVLTGPRGFLDNVRSKLGGYTWNLIEDYPVRLRVEELDGGLVRTARFTGACGWQPEGSAERSSAETIHAEEAYVIEVAELDHGIPVLGVALQESERLTVNPDRLPSLGLVPGPWLDALKTAVREKRAPEEPIEAAVAGGSTQRFALGRLSAELLSPSPGQRLVYLSDLRGTTENLERAARLARGATLLICEAVFLHRDAALARERNHLTARQAGELARHAGARQLAPFHLSRRYDDDDDAVFDEAAQAFGGPVVRLPAGPDLV